MSGHYVRTKAAMLGHLGNIHGKCPMSDHYFKLCKVMTSLTALMSKHCCMWIIFSFTTCFIQQNNHLLNLIFCPFILSFSPTGYRGPVAILFSIIIVVILCVIGVVYSALHFGAPNTIDIDTIKEYALTDKVVRLYNRYFCQGLLGKSTDSPNNFDSNATLYLLNSRPLLTDHEVFNLSQKANLDSVNTNYQNESAK